MTFIKFGIPIDQTDLSQRPTTQNKRINIDREIQHSEHDTFDWATRARRLGEFLVFRVETPITIGIQGDWGSGKSSFINLVETSLGEEQPAVADAPYPLARQLRHYVCTEPRSSQTTANAYVLRFDSWTFAQSNYDADELFPLYVMQAIEHYLRATKRLKEETNVLERLKQVSSTATRIGLAAFANLAGDATSEAVQRELSATATQMVNMLSSFKADFQSLIQTLLRYDENQSEKRDRLILIIDDLDRITPLSAVELTEKIKVLMDVEGIVFILAADLSIIQDGLREKFGPEAAMSNGKNYLDKIVKIQYNVPHLQERDQAKLALGYGLFREMFGFSQHTDPATILDTVVMQLVRAFPTIGGNIRNLKRVLNNFEFSAYLYSTDDSSEPNQHIGVPLIAVTILYQYDHDLARRFYHWLLRQDDDGVISNLVVEQAKTYRGFATALSKDMDYADEAQEHMAEFFRLLASQEYQVHQWQAAFTATSQAPVEVG